LPWLAHAYPVVGGAVHGPVPEAHPGSRLPPSVCESLDQRVLNDL
jgi:hypothetical protein